MSRENSKSFSEWNLHMSSSFKLGLLMMTLHISQSRALVLDFWGCKPLTMLFACFGGPYPDKYGGQGYIMLCIS